MLLSTLKPGESAVIEGIDSGSAGYVRLRDIGMTNGTRVTCVLVSPLGNPSAYLIRGAVIALRSEDSSCVQIRR